MLVAYLARPAPPAATASPSLARATASASVTPTATAAATADRNVPAACAADVRGRTFATGTLEERLAGVRTWAASNRGQSASLVLTDTVLTEGVRAGLSGPDAPPFRDPTVAIRPEAIRVTGTATAAFLRFPIRAALVPQVSGGALRFTISELETGGLPGAFRPQVERLIAQAADPSAWALPLRVDAFTLRSGCAVLVGQA